MPERIEVKTEEIKYRALAKPTETDLKSLDEETRSIGVVIATDSKEVTTWDCDLGRVPEILIPSGCVIPKNRKVSFLDNHDRWSVRSVLGSAREIEVKNNKVIGRIFFSSKKLGEEAYTDYKEGHLTDVSAGWIPREIIKLNEKQKTDIEGRTYSGPAIIVTKFELREVSSTPIGGDSKAKVRNSNEKIKERSKGMAAPEKKEDAENPVIKTRSEEEVKKEALEQEKIRTRSILSLCKTHNCMDLSERAFKEDLTVEEVKDEILKLRSADMENETSDFKVEIIVEERDKFRSAAQDSIKLRCGFAIEKPAPGASDLRGRSMTEISRKFLKASNLDRNGDSMDVVGRALTTTDLPIVLGNIANTSLEEGFDSAEETWDQWCDTGSVSDFKKNKSARLSEVDGLEKVHEYGEYKEGSFEDAQEEYFIETFGKIYTISRIALINDDLGALTDLAKEYGEASSRLIGDVAYSCITANAKMGDNIALFNKTTHKNLIDAGTVGSGKLGEAMLAMRTQKDMKGKKSLNIPPQFLLAPACIEEETETFFRSQFWDAGQPAATKANIHHGTKIKRVYETRLDDDSVTNWYLAARKGKTVKVFFLNGKKKPYLETKEGFSVDGIRYKVRMDVGAKAMSWKTLIKVGS